MMSRFRRISTLALLFGGLFAVSYGATATDSDWVSARTEAKGLTELANALNNRERALDLRERALDSAALDLATAESRLDDKIAALTALDARVSASLDGLDEAQGIRITGLVKMMERMRPKDSAALMTELDETLGVVVLNQMNRTKAGKLLAEMSPLVAAKRVEMMTKPIPLGVR